MAQRRHSGETSVLPLQLEARQLSQWRRCPRCSQRFGCRRRFRKRRICMPCVPSELQPENNHARSGCVAPLPREVLTNGDGLAELDGALWATGGVIHVSPCCESKVAGWLGDGGRQLAPWIGRSKELQNAVARPDVGLTRDARISLDDIGDDSGNRHGQFDETWSGGITCRRAFP